MGTKDKYRKKRKELKLPTKVGPVNRSFLLKLKRKLGPGKS